MKTLKLICQICKEEVKIALVGEKALDYPISIFCAEEAHLVETIREKRKRKVPQR